MIDPALNQIVYKNLTLQFLFKCIYQQKQSQLQYLLSISKLPVVQYQFMSASKSPMSGLKVKETMFEFLKRKKHIQLESSFKNNPQTHRKSLNESKYSSYRKQSHHRMHSTLDYDDFVLDSSIQDRQNRQTTQRSNHIQSASITPRKISFRLDENENRTQRQKSSRKALVQMISPLKNQHSQYMASRSKERAMTSQPKKGILKNKSQKGDTSQLFTKRRINDSIGELRNVVGSLYSSGHTAKIKVNQLVRHLSSTNRDFLKNDTVLRQLGELKFEIKGIQNGLKIFQQQENYADTVLERIQHLITQQINSFQATINQNYKKKIQEEVQQVETNKNDSIQQLRGQNYKLQRMNEKLQNKIQKLEKQLETSQNQYIKREENLLEKIESSNKFHKEKLSQKQQEIMQLKDDIITLRTEKIQFEKQLKNLKFGWEKQINRQDSTKMEQAQTREQYLLKQIEHLKQQFSCDIQKLHKLYQTKNEEFHKKIMNLTESLEQQKYERKCDRQITDKVLAEANINKQQVSRLKNKHDQMLRDLYRMNEQLYQHWLALKDIKTLGSRLNFYHHLQGIYRDLAFNERLF